MRATGARSVAALVAWKLGTSSANAHTITTIAGRLEQFPRCAQGMREGQLSLDQVGVIAARAAEGSDEHYAQLAAVATVNQLRTAVKLEPRPDPSPGPNRRARSPRPPPRCPPAGASPCPHEEAAIFDAALKSHHDALIADWKADHDTGGTEQSPPLPSTVDGFLRLIEAGWDAEAARRPHGRTPPSWSTSTSSATPPPCTWARCSPMPNAGI